MNVMYYDPIATVVAAVLALLALITVWNIFVKLWELFVPSIKKEVYKICYGDPIEPYRIGKLPESWRYNPRLFDNTKLFK